MQKIDLKKFSDQELDALKSALQKELAERKRQKTREARLLARIQKMADSEGVPLERLLAAQKKQKPPRKKGLRGKKAQPKYQNPEQQSEKWSGRGRKPAWVQTWLDKGGKLEELLIN